jgi:hypothetical protein
MSHKQRAVLEAIFHEPPKANIQWREVESLLNHLGATIKTSHGARATVILNRHEFSLHHPHHGNEFSRDAIKDLRQFLANAGCTLSLYDEQRKQEHKQEHKQENRPGT